MISGTATLHRLALRMCIYTGLIVFASSINAGEIIVGSPEKISISVDGNASRQRESARERSGEQTVVTTPNVMMLPGEEPEDGIMLPRQAPPGTAGGSAAENSARARAYQQSSVNTSTKSSAIILDPSSAAQQTPSAQQARSQRAKAIEQSKGKQTTSSAFSTAAATTDGLPVVDCNAVENVAGRIGDARSGSVIILIQGQNQIKARCR